MAAKTLPNDVFAEQSVIGSMFLSKYAVTKVIESLNVDSFFLDSHKSFGNNNKSSYLITSNSKSLNKSFLYNIISFS